MSCVRIFAVCWLLVLSSVVAFAQEVVGSDASATTQGPQPKLVANPMKLDMGLIPDDRPTKAVFELRNEGAAPLEITRVRASCGCTSAAVDDEQLEPGATTKLAVELDTRRLSGGPTHKSVTVYSNDPEHPELVLQFTATIDQGYLFEPERLDFGTVQKGEQPTRTVIMRCTSDTPVAIERIRPLANSRYFAFDYKERPKEEWANPSRPEYLITLQLKPEAPVGALREAYHVLTNRLRNKSTRYLVSADIESFYRVAPSGTYSIGVLGSGEEKPYPIRVMADKPVTVKNVRTSAPYVQARVEPTEDPNEVNIFVTLSEDAPQGYIRDQAITFTVESDGKTQEETLFLKGRIRNAAPPLIRGSGSQRGPVPGSTPADLQPEEMSP